VVVALLALAALSAGCRPLYLPITTEGPPVAKAPSLNSEAALSWSAVSQRLELRLRLLGAEGGGWLAVQWLAPDGREAASASTWVTSEGGESGAVLLVSPPDLEGLAPGEWRAIVSYEGRLLRQFRAVIPAPAEDPAAPGEDPPAP